MKSKKLQSLISLILVIVFVLATLMSGLKTFGEQSILYSEEAQKLYQMGLFKGTDKGFELEKKATRAEAAVMLVRVLGKEEEALKISGVSIPFTDVPKWAKQHITYLYKNGLTQGVSASLYGSTKQITGNEYTTMLLRSLGFKDSKADFNWNQAIEFSKNISLITPEEYKVFSVLGKQNILRDHMVKLSYNTITYKGEKPVQTAEEIRGVWISYLEFQSIFSKYNTEEQFRQYIKGMFENMSNIGLNAAFVQVRAFSDAIYPSEYYPWSNVISKTEGVNPGFDPLKIIIEQAKLKNIEVHAWINPYRIRPKDSKIALSNDNIAKLWSIDGSNRVISIPTGIFFNPGSQDARNLIVNGVKELAVNYEIDGIHFDDYFYPSDALDYDLYDYQKYLSNGGSLSQQNWRRENNDKLVKAVYSAIKQINSDISFGISPQGNNDVNYNKEFIDVEKWVKNKGYIDYICPQIYFGYQHSRYPYRTLLLEWDEMVKGSNVELYAGIAAYKVGKIDQWAGTTGINEWIDNSNLISRMIWDAQNTSTYGGFCLFRYDFLNSSDNNMQQEIILLKKLLQ